MHPTILRALAAALLASPAAAFVQADNFILVVADDMGADLVGTYDLATPVEPTTPRLDLLASQGVTFLNGWGYSRCSPTRATLLTGRFGFHTGIGSNVNPNQTGWAVQPEEQTVPETLGATHATGHFGKWHMTNPTVGGDLAPNLAGFDHFSGFIQQLRLPEEYYEFDKVVNGVTEHVVNYRASEVVDDAVEWIASVPEPFFASVNFSLPHGPFHVPPAHLHTQTATATFEEKRAAMVEAMDTEIGRLVDSLPSGVKQRTTLIFVGDNGSSAKGTLYEGGVKVPFIVAGARVAGPGRRILDPVCTVDLQATLATLLGIPVAPYALDSISFKPHLDDLPPGHQALNRIRKFGFTERFEPNGLGEPVEAHRAVRGKRYKLIRRPTHDELYDLRTDPQEQLDLLSDPAYMTHLLSGEYSTLSTELQRVLDS